MPDTLADTDILRAAVQLACRASISGKINCQRVELHRMSTPLTLATLKRLMDF
jgi:hypothetical protein